MVLNKQENKLCVNPHTLYIYVKKNKQQKIYSSNIAFCLCIPNPNINKSNASPCIDFLMMPGKTIVIGKHVKTSINIKAIYNILAGVILNDSFIFPLSF